MPDTYSAFAGQQRIAAGHLLDISAAVKAAFDVGSARLLVFNDRTGGIAELDLRGSLDDVIERLRDDEQDNAPPAKPVRGRPKLGVTAREVTLLPSHWEWLAAQRGGASAALRRLVDQARRTGNAEIQEAEEAARRVLLALAGDLPDYEEATRAFYSRDYVTFEKINASWPADIAAYVRVLVQRVATMTSAPDV